MTESAVVPLEARWRHCPVPRETSAAIRQAQGAVPAGRRRPHWMDYGISRSRGIARHGELVERDCQPPARWLVDRQLVMASPDGPHEGMPGDRKPGAAPPLERHCC